MPAKPQPADAVPVFHFSTDAFPERERLAAWREIFGRTVVNLDIEPLSPDGFHAHATVCQLPGLGVLYAASEAVQLTHSRDLILNDDLSFMAAPTCSYEAFQHGRTPVLGPGDGVLMNNAEVGSMRLASASRFTTFRVPVAAIAALIPDIGAAIARPIPAADAALRLLVGYLASALDTEALMTPELQQLAVTHVYDLLALALGATRDAAAIAVGRGVRAARLRAAKAFITRAPCPPRAVGGDGGGASRRHAALRSHAVRDRGRIALGMRAGAAARARAPHAHGSPSRRPPRQRHRVRCRLRRPVALQSHLPPPLRRHAVGCARGGGAARTRMRRRLGDEPATDPTVTRLTL